MYLLLICAAVTHRMYYSFQKLELPEAWSAHRAPHLPRPLGIGSGMDTVTKVWTGLEESGQPTDVRVAKDEDWS